MLDSSRHGRAPLLFLLAVFLLIPHSFYAGTIRIGTFNSATNGEIESAHLLLTHQETRTVLKLERAHFESPLHVPDGTWQISAHAAGFHTLYTSLVSDANSSVSVDLFLDPVTQPSELQQASIDRQRRDDATLVVGFVADRESGLPLSGVHVLGGTGKVTTDAKGYYSVYLPVTSDWSKNRLVFIKDGYVLEERTGLETWSFGDWIVNVRMQRGSGTKSISESKAERGASQQLDECTACNTDGPSGTDNAVVPISASIRVGRTCSGTSCSTVEVYTMQTYAKYVLPAEWYSCWGSLANGMNSLQAGAVAIRSYGLWYVYNPLRTNYDICDNTSCQALGSVQSTNANNAVDATDRWILLTASNAVARSEYSAENNNKGCGDGYTGTGTSWPCILDLPCQTQTPNGHGRGMCQWGSARWANGTRVLTTSPCSQGTSHGQGTKTWQQILSHYYPTYTLVQGATASMQGTTTDPTSVAQGSTMSIQYTLTTTHAMSLILGASIAPNGSGTLTSDSPRDIKASLFEGGNIVSRSFVVPATQPTGAHDLYVSLWHDKNNNNIIDTGDFVVASAQYNNKFTVTILPVQLVSFTATSPNNRDVELRWRTLSEVNNLGFYVQRRILGDTAWTELANSFVPGHGTTNIPRDYMYVDVNAGPGNWQYRLRQLDLDSTEHFTDPVEIQITTGVALETPSGFMLWQNYPNPFNPETEIRFSVEKTGPTTLEVYDMLGRKLLTLFENTAQMQRVYSVRLNAEKLASGVYTYVLASGHSRAAKRMVVLK